MGHLSYSSTFFSIPGIFARKPESFRFYAVVEAEALLGEREDDFALPFLAFFQGFAELIGLLGDGGFFAGVGAGGFDLAEML